MGKLRRGRQKAHIAAVKVKGADDKASGGQVETVTMDTNQDVSLPSSAPFKSNLFEGLDLSKFNLKANLPDLDARSAITSKSLKELKMKKKDKQKLRHDLWLKKVSAIDTAKKMSQERKRKQQTPVVGDIGALGEALPTLELLLKGSTGPRIKREQEPRKPRGIEKEKRRKKQMMDDISIFKQVLKHPAYKENATGTISEHLHNKQDRENMDT